MRYKIFEQSSQRKSEMRIFSRSGDKWMCLPVWITLPFGSDTLTNEKHRFRRCCRRSKENARLRDAQSPQLAFFTDHFEHSECGRQEWPGAQGEFLASLFPSINYIIT
jgi:hypothetical protein